MIAPDRRLTERWATRVESPWSRVPRPGWGSRSPGISRDAFFLDDADWQEAVCVRARDVVERALHGVATFRPEESR